MLGDERGLETRDALGEPVEVVAAKGVGRAQRKPDPMEAQRVALAETFEPRERRAAVGEEILGVDLEECQRRAPLEERGVVRRAQPDADAARERGAGQLTCPCPRRPAA